MAESKIRDDNYYQISGWMLNKLRLKGIALEVYAIIYGFSQDGDSEFTGSLQYLCDFTGGTSKPTIIKALKELTEKGYIIRREEIVCGVQLNRYKANLPLLKNFNGGGKETLMGGSKEILTGGSKETLPNNKSLDNKSLDNKSLDNKSDKKKASKRGSFDNIILEYANTVDINIRAEVTDLLFEWLKVRKAKRSAMTDRAIQMNIDKLNDLAKASNMTVAEYLKEVIRRGWAAFYEIKPMQGGGKPLPTAKTRARSFDIEAYERLTRQNRPRVPTAADDENLRQRVEALRQRIAGNGDETK